MQILLPYATIQYKEPIVFITFRENVELGFPEILDLTRCSEELSRRKPYVVLSDISNSENFNLTTEGRRYAHDETKAPFHKGSAVLCKNSIMELATNVFISFGRIKYPYKAFSDKDRAIEWLLSINLNKTNNYAQETISQASSGKGAANH